MSKQFIVTVLVAILLGLGFLNYAITKNCTELVFENDCTQNFSCKIKVIKTKEEAEKEIKERGSIGIAGPREITQCVPVYKFW